MRPNTPDLRFDYLDRLDQVRVATWPDGTELWRTGLAAMSPADPTTRLTFRTTEDRTDWSTTDVLDAVGFSTGFVLLPNIDPPLLSTLSSDQEVLDRFSKHGRWLLSSIGMQETKHSPVWHQVSDSSHTDPFVCRLSMSWEEAFKEARRLDVRLRHVHQFQGPHRFVDVATQIGDSGLCEDVIFFLEDLVQIGWVKAASEPLRVSGELKCKFLRPTSREAQQVRKERKWLSATPVPQGWSTTSSLDLQRNLSVHGVVKWLEDDHEHEQILILTADLFDPWFEAHTYPGRLTIGDDEVEIFRMLGEDLPYLWLEPKLRAWALERWA